MRHIEIEYKQILNKEVFESLRSYFKHAQFIQQENHYYLYEDPSLMLSTRIRKIEDKAVLTFKQKHLEAIIENHFELKHFEEDIFNREDVLLFLKNQNLHLSFTYIGKMVTHRYLVVENNQEICLDENHYLGQIDYELEVETLIDPKQAKQRFDELCVLFSIEKQHTLSKFARFIKQKEA